MTLESDIRRLAAIPLFALLGTEALRLIAFSAETRMFRADDVLFKRGEAADCGFVILIGTVALEGPRPGEETVIGPGALIGERALITEVERPVTAVAREATTVLKISRRLFYRVLSEFPECAPRLRMHVAGALSLRLHGHRPPRLEG